MISGLFRSASLAFVLLFSGASYADEPSTENRALAEVLFREAKSLTDAQQFEQACPKFQESHRLDPKPGTILNLAVCHEKQGKIASAWLDYIEAATFAARAGQKDRETFAKDQAAKLEKMLPRLVVRVPAKPPSGFVVNVDSAPLSEAAWGSAAPINPGSHSIAATAPGYKAWSTTVNIESKPGNVDVVVPSLEPNPGDTHVETPTDSGQSNGTTGNGQEKPHETGVRSPSPTPAFNKMMWIGVAAGGVGVVGLILGTALGVNTFSKRDAGNAECRPAPLYTYCTKAGIELHSQAETSAAISTTGFVLGGLGLGAGAILVVLGMRQNSSAPAKAWVLPHVGPTGTGLSAGMSF